MMRGAIATLWALAAIGLAAGPGHAEAPPIEDVAPEPGDRTAQLLEQAIAAYSEAQEQTERDRRLEGFRRAERLFGGITATGIQSPELYANLGNAALQAERLGPAILAYKRALRLEPGLARARQNLEHARSLLPSWVPTPTHGGVLDSFFFWHRTLSRDARTSVASICILLAGICAAAAVYWRSNPLTWLAAAPLVAWLALVTSLALDPARANEDDGVVTAAAVVARGGDSTNAPVLFGDPLPGGTEIVIVDDRGDWLQIRLHNGRTAWVSASGVERVAES